MTELGDRRLPPPLTDTLLRTAIAAAPDGILVVDADGDIVFANPMASELFGYDEHALAGSNIDTLLPEALRSHHAEHRSNYMHRPRTRAMGSGLDLHARKRSGEDFPVDQGPPKGRRAALNRADGEFLKLLGLCTRAAPNALVRHFGTPKFIFILSAIARVRDRRGT